MTENEFMRALSVAEEEFAAKINILQKSMAEAGSSMPEVDVVTTVTLSPRKKSEWRASATTINARRFVLVPLVVERSTAVRLCTSLGAVKTSYLDIRQLICE